MALESRPSNPLRSSLTAVIQWFDADFSTESREKVMNKPDGVEWVRCLPFIFLHAGCLGIFWMGWSWVAAGMALFMYLIRMFAITGFYHRYFSHRTFQTSRAAQFLFALLGASATQRGPLWWAYQHRHHHLHSDEEDDRHSPRHRGFWWAHVGWILSARNFPTDYSRVRDLARYPELVFLNRFDALIPALLGGALFAFGAALASFFPGLGTSAGQMLVWGFFISTTFLFHATSSINSLAHLIGRKRYVTNDDSRNSFLLALITLGEGWHNNHHQHMSAARQGFFWWEIDISYYTLKVLSWTGLIWNLRPVPLEAYQKPNAMTRRHERDPAGMP